MNDDFIGPYDPSKELQIKNEFTQKIVIHVYQRTGRKYLTVIEGIQYHIENVDDFLKQTRKECSCNGCLKRNDEGETTVQFQGNKKIELVNILTKQYNIKQSNIVIRGI